MPHPACIPQIVWREGGRTQPSRLICSTQQAAPRSLGDLIPCPKKGGPAVVAAPPYFDVAAAAAHTPPAAARTLAGTPPEPEEGSPPAGAPRRTGEAVWRPPHNLQTSNQHASHV